MDKTLLMEQVKRKVNVTWEDNDTTARLEEIINSAIPYLIHRLGIADNNYDFSNAGLENTLFLSYCLYEWNHCLNEFEDNYANMIAIARDKHRVNYHIKELEESDESEE